MLIRNRWAFCAVNQINYKTMFKIIKNLAVSTKGITPPKLLIFKTTTNYYPGLVNKFNNQELTHKYRQIKLNNSSHLLIFHPFSWVKITRFAKTKKQLLNLVIFRKKLQNFIYQSYSKWNLIISAKMKKLPVKI